MRWLYLAGFLIVGALAVRIALIKGFATGGADVQIYVYCANAAAHGLNPYALGPGVVDPAYCDFPPVEMALFAGVLKLHESVGIFTSINSLRLLFVAIDALLLVGVATARSVSLSWRRNFLFFYGFNPFVLIAWTTVPEDKGIYFALTVGVVLGFRAYRAARVWAYSTALAMFKWLTAFFAIPLLVEMKRRVGLRMTAIGALLAMLFIALGHLPWLPDSLDAYSRRDTRTLINPPQHASVTKALDAVGLYSPSLVKPLIVLSILGVALLYLRKWLQIEEAVCLSIFAAFIWLPDSSFDRVVLMMLTLLLAVRMTAARWGWLWAVSLVSAASLASVEGVWARVSGSLGKTALDIAGPYASTRHVVAMNIVLLPPLFWIVRDVFHRRQRHKPPLQKRENVPARAALTDG